MKRRFAIAAVLPPLLLTGCLSIKTEPIEVKPIRITVDVNVKVEQAVSSLLSDIYGDSSTVSVPPSKS
ncbi:MAG: hypothetical protein PHQ04_02510 [Opitutaceae bacterium]|nr:hypothetical protein [Opitutaceae bacterium]